MTKNNSTFTNTDGWGNKLVTIFARHLDNLILKRYLSVIYKNRDSGSGQILQPRQFYLSPGLAKIAPCFASCGLRKTVMKTIDPANGLRSTQQRLLPQPPGRYKKYAVVLGYSASLTACNKMYLDK